MESKIHWPWVIAGMVLMAALSWGNGQPEAAGLIPAPWDKLAHFLVFGGLTWVLLRGLGRRRWWLVLGVVAGFAGYDELRQFTLPGRHPGLDDLAADMIAIVAVTTGNLWIQEIRR